ncbi:hypothetical protein BH10ACT8_BH10ACT8_15860 [soil metagenome]|jgi:hypothetical protein
MRTKQAARAAALSLAVMFALAGFAPAADAHSLLGPPIPEAAHYLTEVSGVSPALPGVTATVDPHGDWIQISNTSAQTLTILGYGREPYLRIDSQGVQQNVNSPSVYLNQSLFTDLSQSTEENLPPKWEAVTAGRGARWHDHRIHWMGAGRAPNVAAHPGVRQVVGQWTVRLLLGNTPVIVSGTLSWLPLSSRRGLSTIDKVVLGVDCLVFTVGAGFIWRMRRHPGLMPDELSAEPMSDEPGIGSVR